MRILLAVDEALSTEEAARVCADWFPGAEVVALHAAAPNSAVVQPVLGAGLESGAALAGYRIAQEATDDLDLVQTSADIVDGEIKTVPGAVTASIEDELAGGGYDLVVLGDRERGALSSIVQGSIVERIVRESPVPVLVVPPSVSDSSV